MMKTYSIGREHSCDIVINDSTDVISRRHALLNVAPSGKMTIIDQSSNGTYVNGIRISPNVPVPVTRKDVISLAHVAKLNWDLIPKSNVWVKYVGIAAAVIVVAVAAVIGIRSLSDDSGNGGGGSADTTVTVQPDTVKAEGKEPVKTDTVKASDAAKAEADSLKKAQEKAKADSIQKAKKKTAKSKKGKETQQPDTTKTDTKRTTLG